MDVKFFKFLLISELVLHAIAWICMDGICDPTGGVERCFDLFHDQYVKITSNETVYVKRRLYCDVMCYRKRCSCYMYLPDTSCVMVFIEWSPAAAANVLHLMGTNVALSKTTLGSTIHGSGVSSNAVDGKITDENSGDTFHTATGDKYPYFQIDLNTAQLIKGIRIIARQDVSTLRFMNIKIYVTNFAVGSGAVENGVVVSEITSIPPGFGYWWNIRLDDMEEKYRYVFITRKEEAHHLTYLEISEIEILV